MEIRYINNNEDMKQKAYFNTVNSESFKEENKNLKNIYRFMAIALRAFGVLMIVMYYANNSTDQNQLARAFTMPFAGLMMYLFSLGTVSVKKFFLKRSVNKKYRNNNAVYPETTITVDSKNITCVSGKEKEVHKLTEEMDVYETQDCYLNDLKKNQIVLPKRVLDEETFEEFDRHFKIRNRLAKTAEKMKEKK